jgi:plastocyanin
MNWHRLLMALGAALMVSALMVAVRGHVARAATQNVTVADFSFTDATSGTATTTITAGDTVMWAWTGAAQHTVTSDAPGTELDSGAPQAAGTYVHAFSTVGTFQYHCEVHPTQMTGTVVVQAAAAPTSTSQPAASSTPVTPTVTPISTGTPISTDTPAPALTPAATPAVVAPPVAPPQPDAGTGAATQLPRTGTGEHRGYTPAGDAIVLALLGGVALGGALVARRRA